MTTIFLKGKRQLLFQILVHNKNLNYDSRLNNLCNLKNGAQQILLLYKNTDN